MAAEWEDWEIWDTSAISDGEYIRKEAPAFTSQGILKVGMGMI